MTHIARLGITLIIIFASLACGYLVKHALDSGRLKYLSSRIEHWRINLQSIAVFFLLPLAAMLSLWGLPKPDPELFILPFLGLCAYTLGGGLAILAARFMRLSRSQTGAFYCCGAFNNMGAVGGLVCLIFLGESSIALVALFRLFEELYYFSLSFPVARHYADPDFQLKKISYNKNFFYILALIIAALGSGIILNLCHITRPKICGVAASMSMLCATVIFLFAIGLTLKLHSIKKYLLPSLALCLIKFMLVPAIMIFLALFSGVGSFDNSLALKVVAILSAMPVAMTALVPPALFGLDLDLANTCWIVTTLCLVAVLPVLFYILPLL